ncbi:MAG: Gfo/Idh/MocA family oxidoreductase, partial [Deltaproteobacteria bacterium]
MYVRNMSSWHNSFLDYHRAPGNYRVSVELYIILKRIEHLHTENWKFIKIINYIKELGLWAVIRKARSRLNERLRNEKFLACGIGTICEADPDKPHRLGQKVLFIAPCHPQCVERIVLPPQLLKPLPEGICDYDFQKSEIVWVDARQYLKNDDLIKLVYYSQFSGRTIDEQLVKRAFALVEEIISKPGMLVGQKLETSSNPVTERYENSSSDQDGRLRAVIFGYGHYAKTIIIPNLDRAIRVAKVHEIDPMQLGPVKRLPFDVDSSPMPRPDERFDVICIAGYHHTHATLGIYGLKKDCYVIIEKPPVTTWDQLHELLEAMDQSEGKLFVGYTRRYLVFNKFIRKDLGLKDNEPLSYYCIVNMARMPKLHWYHWPNAGSQIISNGCHWIDHFLFLNDYVAFKSYGAIQFNNEDIVCWAELENGSTFNMVITQDGSMRTGYRENIEIRSKDSTVRIRDLSHYTAEGPSRILRKANVNKPVVYMNMYRTVSHKIVAGQAGDTRESLERTASLMLGLED